jgi:hypothetical protein
VGLQAVEGVVMERPDGGFLDGAVHALGPGVIRLGELVGDGLLTTDAIKGMQAILRRRPPSGCGAGR